MHLKGVNQKSVVVPLKPVMPSALGKYWTTVNEDEVRKIRSKYTIKPQDSDIIELPLGSKSNENKRYKINQSPMKIVSSMNGCRIKNFMCDIAKGDKVRSINEIIKGYYITPYINEKFNETFSIEQQQKLKNTCHRKHNSLTDEARIVDQIQKKLTSGEGLRFSEKDNASVCKQRRYSTQRVFYENIQQHCSQGPLKNCEDRLCNKTSGRGIDFVHNVRCNSEKVAIVEDKNANCSSNTDNNQSGTNLRGIKDTNRQTTTVDRDILKEEYRDKHNLANKQFNAAKVSLTRQLGYTNEPFKIKVQNMETSFKIKVNKDQKMRIITKEPVPKFQRASATQKTDQQTNMTDHKVSDYYDNKSSNKELENLTTDILSSGKLYKTADDKNEIPDSLVVGCIYDTTEDLQGNKTDNTFLKSSTDTLNMNIRSKHYFMPLKSMLKNSGEKTIGKKLKDTNITQIQLNGTNDETEEDTDKKDPPFVKKKRYITLNEQNINVFQKNGFIANLSQKTFVNPDANKHPRHNLLGAKHVSNFDLHDKGRNDLTKNKLCKSLYGKKALSEKISILKNYGVDDFSNFNGNSLYKKVADIGQKQENAQKACRSKNFEKHKKSTFLGKTDDALPIETEQLKQKSDKSLLDQENYSEQEKDDEGNIIQQNNFSKESSIEFEMDFEESLPGYQLNPKYSTMSTIGIHNNF